MLFTRQNKAVKRENQFIWFEKWVLHRQTIPYIAKQSGYGVRTLKRLFDEYLSKLPLMNIYPKERLNLIIDGTYFSNDICLIVYRDDQIKFTQLYRITDGEHYSEIKEDLANLLLLGVQIESITCDGHRSLVSATENICPEAMLQRCVVHIQRECRIWLTANPKSGAGLDLLQIVQGLHRIKNHQQSQQWIMDFLNWHKAYRSFINEKSYNPITNRYWYTHKFVRRSFTHIKRALPYMFTYLFNDRVPKSTNGLESFFGHLKSHLLLHRGLTKEHRKSFIRWYLYFKNRQ